MKDKPLGAVEALALLGGSARQRQVAALSSRTRIRTAVRRGEIVRVGHGRLVLSVADRGLRMAQGVNGYVSHLTAALHHGCGVKFPPDLPQLTIPNRQKEQEEPEDFLADVHRRPLPGADRTGWATSKLRTVLDCARDLPFDEALCVADSALRAGDVTADELVTAAAGYRGPGSERVRRVAAYADGRAANPFESVLRAICIEIGLPVIPQYAVTCAGLELHPDLANPFLGLAIEADSYEFHGMEKWDHDRDCSRYNALTSHGWAVLRFTWEHVMRNPDYVKRTIRAWLAEHEGSELNADRPRRAG